MTANWPFAGKHPIVNVGTGKPVSIAQVVNQISKEITSIGKPVAPYRFSGMNPSASPKSLVADLSRFSEWGYAGQVGLPEGIRAVAHSILR